MEKEAVILIGIQGSGKSTFTRERFFDTHVRINLDMLRTRQREKLLFEACLESGTSFVADDTNVTRAERAAWIEPAKARGYRVLGYFFRSRVNEALDRNQRRPPSRRVPEEAIKATSGRLELPKLAEGFDQLFFVVSHHDDSFTIEDWRE
jgi:predicted kinase